MQIPRPTCFYHPATNSGRQVLPIISHLTTLLFHQHSVLSIQISFLKILLAIQIPIMLDQALGFGFVQVKSGGFLEGGRSELSGTTHFLHKIPVMFLSKRRQCIRIYGDYVFQQLLTEFTK